MVNIYTKFECVFFIFFSIEIDTRLATSEDKSTMSGTGTTENKTDTQTPTDEEKQDNQNNNAKPIKKVKSKKGWFIY